MFRNCFLLTIFSIILISNEYTYLELACLPYITLPLSILQPWLKLVFLCTAYETLSDETRRREYDQFSDTSAYFTGETQGGHRPGANQRYTFKFDDIFKDFDIYSQNRHARHRRHFDERSRSHGRHKRHFQGGFKTDIFGDMFEDMEKPLFTFDGHTKQKQHCITVTQRRGNMVTTYTDCTAS